MTGLLKFTANRKLPGYMTSSGRQAQNPQSKDTSLLKLQCHIKAYGIKILLKNNMRSLWFRGK